MGGSVVVQPRLAQRGYTGRMNIEVLMIVAVALLLATLMVLVLLWRRASTSTPAAEVQQQLVTEREQHRLALVDAGQLRGRPKPAARPACHYPDRTRGAGGRVGVQS